MCQPWWWVKPGIWTTNFYSSFFPKTDVLGTASRYQRQNSESQQRSLRKNVELSYLLGGMEDLSKQLLEEPQ